MKNLFLAIAFMLCGTFAFANNGEVNDVKFDKEIVSEVVSEFDVQLKSFVITEESVFDCSITVTVITEAGTYTATYNGPCSRPLLMDFLLILAR